MHPGSLSQIVENGLCSGCGLCQGVAGNAKVRMVLTSGGWLRPFQRGQLPEPIRKRVLRVCPGSRIAALPIPRAGTSAKVDPVWGVYRRLAHGWASDSELRGLTSRGGILSALAVLLLETGAVDCVLHVAPSRVRPLRTVSRCSRNRSEILSGAQARYGPSAPLSGLLQLLEAQQPFAFIGKPCDVGAVRNLSRIDPRVGRYCRYLLSFPCRGTPSLAPSSALLADLHLDESEVSAFRYVGDPESIGVRVQTRDGRLIERRFQPDWLEAEAVGMQNRCRICPDSVGLSADLVVGDLNSDGEGTGINWIMARTLKGAALLESGVAASAVSLAGSVTIEELNRLHSYHFHQRRAAWARLLALRNGGRLVPAVSGLSLQQLARDNGLRSNLREARQTLRRALDGYSTEPPVHPMDSL